MTILPVRTTSRRSNVPSSDSSASIPAVCWRVENRSGRPGRRVVSRGVDRLQGQRVARGSRPPGRADGPLFRRVRRGGRVEGDPGRRLSVSAIRRIIRSRAAAVGIEGRVCIRSQSPGWWRAIAGRRRGLDCRDADGGQVAVTGDAGPLCTGRRRSRPLRSRIKPGSTSSTITSLIGGGDVVVTLTFSVNIYRAPHNTPVLTQYRMDTMFRLMFRLLKLKPVQQELRDRWDAGDRVGLVVRPARCPRRTRVGKLSIWLRVGSCDGPWALRPRRPS